MNVQDDLYLGSGFTLGGQSSANPTLQQGCGPMGRTAVRSFIPLTKQAANIAALQHVTTGGLLVLAAGTGVTAGVAPDGSGRAVIVLDVPRCLSFTTSADMHLVTLTVVGFDEYGAQMSQAKVLGSSATTVNTLKAFKSVLSITSNATDGTNNVSVGTADIFGLQFAIADVGYIAWNRWAETLAADAGTFVAADQTIPATTLTGDVRGTYAPSSASDGTKRLVIGMHLISSLCGATAQKFTTVANAVTTTGAIGVPQV